MMTDIPHPINADFSIVFLTTPLPLPENSKEQRITLEWRLIPYLSLQENILLGVEKKNSKNTELLQQLTQQFNLEKTFLKTQEQLTSFERVKLQFLHSLLLQKQKIYFDNVCSAFSIRETQEFLHLCQKIAKTHNLAILLTTTDPSLIKTKLDTQ